MSGGGADAPSSPASMLEGLERTNDDDQEATGRGGGEPTPNPPRRSPRKSPAGNEQARLDREKLQKELEAIAKLPWCGQAEKLGATEKEILSHYSHHVVFDKKLKNGEFLYEEPSIKYISKYETAGRERTMSMKGLNATRLGEALLKSELTPDEVKLKVGKKMRSQFAKSYIAKMQEKSLANTMSEVGELEQKRKSAKTDGTAQHNSNERQRTIDKFVLKDAPMPEAHFNLCQYYMAVWFLMSRTPFLVADNIYFRKFLQALRPAFVQKLPVQLRNEISGRLLDEVYEEAKVIAQEKLDEIPGRLTLGIDGHKFGNRHVETITRCKLGISTFQSAELLRRERSTGKKLGELALGLLNESYIAIVADNTSNNSGSRNGLFRHVLDKRPTMICIGCCVHVMDLLVEDLVKADVFAEACADARFLATFTKKHAILYEEFLHCQTKMLVKAQLALFPQTRFAYSYLMCQRVIKNWAVIRQVSESDTFNLLKETARRRGQAGQRSVEEFNRYEQLADARLNRQRIAGTNLVLEPFSIVLHYLEGDSVPISHVYPCYQTLYDFAQQLGGISDISSVVDEQEQEKVCNAVRSRWLGTARKTGLKDDLHFCAFALDPYVQAALTSCTAPECDLLTNEVTAAARNVFKHICASAAQRSILIEQFGLWCAAAPVKSASTGKAAQSGHNSYSSLYLTAMQLVWDKIESAPAVGNQADAASPTLLPMRHFLQRLKHCGKPTEFWLTMQSEAPRSSSSPSAREAHKYFCKVAMELSAVVGHTAGVERAGKGYGMVLTQLRKSLDPVRALKAVYVMENYGLLNLDKEVGSGLEAYAGTSSATDNETAEGQINAAFPRGNLIAGAGNECLSEGEESGEENSEEDADAGDEQSVRWYLPAGFQIARKPSSIDVSCVGKLVLFHWEKFGWQLGKVTELITAATPRLMRNFNVRVAWADGRGPTMLDLDMFQSGDDAPTNSWVFLEKL